MKALIFDTETTGLVDNTAQSLDKQPHIIEFYGCIVEDDGTILEELEFLCDPQVPLEDIIIKITGLKDEDLKGQPLFKEKAALVKAFFAKADAAVAHNLNFDETMLGLEFQRIEDTLKMPERKICTVESTNHFMGHRLNMQKLHHHLFDEGFENGHRARVDVMALKRCYVELVKRGDI